MKIIKLVLFFKFFLILSFTASSMIAAASGQDTTVRFCTVPFIGGAPAYVAHGKGFFKDEDLDVTMNYKAGGWMCLKDLFEGQADIITTAELPIVYSAFDKKKYTDFERGEFYIIADMIYSQQDIQQVVVRKDRNIQYPENLKGKKIGVFKGTTLDYYMDIFFRDYNISYADVEIIDMNVFELTEAIVEGKVDAIFTWQPHVKIALDRLGDNGALFQSRFKYSTSWLLVVMKEFAQNNPETLVRFLNALVKAEDFIQKRPENAMLIHSEVSKTDLQTTKYLWDIVTFDLSLSESLNLLLEGEAKWIIRRGIYNETNVPDFTKYFYRNALQEVKPFSVDLIR